MRLKEIREGLAKLLVPDVPSGKGPGKYVGLPFFNTSMQKNRDMTILFLKAAASTGATVLDGLSATGALGIRAALEVRDVQVTCNDRNPLAVELIRKNSELNRVKLEAINQENLQAHISDNRYDFVDVDPFGTPGPYIDSAMRTARRGGMIAFTATDTAVLCGAQPRACMRRYDAKPLHIDCCKEIALRILIGSIARIAVRYDKAIRPMLSFGTDHYFRVFMDADQGASKADEVYSQIGYACYDRASGKRWLSAEKPSEYDWAGPMWIGSLLAGEVVSRLNPLSYMGHATSILVESLKQEVNAPPLYVNTHFLAKSLKASPPPLEKFLTAIKDGGYSATRTHFDPDGIKTDAPWDELVRLYGGSLAGSSEVGGGDVSPSVG